jgi:hypothetical protein
VTPAGRTPWTFEDVPICNCAACRCDLLGAIPLDRAKDFGAILKTHRAYVPRKTVYGRYDDRPYCRDCHPDTGHGNRKNPASKRSTRAQHRTQPLT